MYHLDKASNQAVQGATCIQMMEDDPPSKLESADSMMLSAIETHFIVVEGNMNKEEKRGPGGDTEHNYHVDTVVDINVENVEDEEEETTSFIKKGLLI